MNPNLLNLLQQQQSQQTSGQEANSAMDNTAVNNPFDSGIRKAIESARQSLGMTRDQENAALRRGMLTFANQIGQAPRERGVAANIASIGRAMIPGMMEYDNYEQNALNSNNNLANQIISYQQQEAQRQAEEEQRQWQRQLQEQALNERKRSTNLLETFRRDKLNQKSNDSEFAINNDLIPITSKSERLLYAKDRKASGEILKELTHIKDEYENLKNITKDDLINPMSPYGIGTISNQIKDFAGYITDNKELQETTKKRKALEASLGKFALELERKIKGGVLSEGMVKRFENKELLPGISDRPEVFEEKLNNLMKELSDRYTSADTSLKYGAHISPYDLEKLNSEKSSRQSFMPISSEATNSSQDYNDDYGYEPR
jgi:hypothetical protein